MKVEKNVDLSRYSYFAIGGRAKYFLEISGEGDFTEICRVIHDIGNIDVYVIGAGSNILISDRGFDGLVIKNSWSWWSKEKNLWKISSGAMLPVVAHDLAKKGVAGLEHLSCVPGTIGGAIRGNAEAYRQSISDHIKEVSWCSFVDCKESNFSKQDCDFVYRGSVFKQKLAGKGMITYALFDFPSADPAKLRKLMEGHKIMRTKSQPPESSCGCFFKNIELSEANYNQIKSILGDEYLIERKAGDMFSAGMLIDLVGLKGERVGGAMVSPIHANFIVNLGEARALDIYNLHKLVAQKVYDKTGIKLEAEVQFCGSFE
ncbi:UDP-N-acetylmuramate dehydrogenase [Patescibacteria group bacterium]|nr:UDP-N-acetylmuramate dehydrogenase [Patescibacteria group bacterium]